LWGSVVADVEMDGDDNDDSGSDCSQRHDTVFSTAASTPTSTVTTKSAQYNGLYSTLSQKNDIKK